jgi:polysaccharide biosynthesis transport protein
LVVRETRMSRLLHVVKGRWLFVVVPAVLGALIFGAVTLRQPKLYDATARLILEANGGDTVTNGFGGATKDASSLDPETEVLRMGASDIRRAVAQLLSINVADAKVSVRVLRSSSVLAVRATSRDPKTAAAIANAFCSQYISIRRAESVAEISRLISAMEARSDEFGRLITETEQAIRAADPLQPGALTNLQINRDRLVTQKGEFDQRIASLRVDSELRTGGARIANAAAAPRLPFAPDVRRALLSGLLIGAIVGLLMAVAREFFREVVRSKEDVSRIAPKLAVLGSIPEIPEFSGTSALAMALVPNSPASEAYRSLRTMVQFLGVDQSVKVLQVTSSRPGEGKSTLAANLALALAQGGRRVALVDTDLRSPRVEEIFGHADYDSRGGLTGVLVDTILLEYALRPSKHQGPEDPIVEANLRVLDAGERPPYPAELLGSNRMVELVASLRDEFDYVILDSPPVLAVSDPLVVAGLVDAVLFVARAGIVQRRQLSQALNQLDQIDAPIAGIVMNGTKENELYQYEYQGLHVSKKQSMWKRITKKVGMADPRSTTRKKLSYEKVSVSPMKGIPDSLAEWEEIGEGVGSAQPNILASAAAASEHVNSQVAHEVQVLDLTGLDWPVKPDAHVATTIAEQGWGDDQNIRESTFERRETTVVFKAVQLPNLQTFVHGTNGTAGMAGSAGLVASPAVIGVKTSQPAVELSEWDLDVTPVLPDREPSEFDDSLAAWDDEVETVTAGPGGVAGESFDADAKIDRRTSVVSNVARIGASRRLSGVFRFRHDNEAVPEPENETGEPNSAVS